MTTTVANNKPSTVRSTSTNAPTTTTPAPQTVDGELGGKTSSPTYDRQGAVRGVEKALSSIDANSFYVSDAKRDALRDALGKLSPDDFKVVVDGLAKRGDLADVVGDGNRRSAFLALAAQKGYVNVAPVQAPEARLPMPPSPASLLQNPPSLPTAVRGLIVDENVDRQAAYKAKYEEYTGEYTAAIASAPSAAALRDLGKLEPYADGAMPGAYDQDPFAIRWSKEKPSAPSSVNAAELITAKVYHLQNKEPPGFSVFVDGKFTVADTVSVGTKYKLNEDGFHHDKDRIGLKGQAGIGVDVSDDGKMKFSAPLPVGSVAVSEKGYDVKIGKGVFVQKGTSWDGMQHDFAVGLGDSMAVAGVKVAAEVKAGVHIGLISPKEMEMFIRPTDVGFFDKTPPEMTAGKTWKQLPDNVRSFYADMFGWTEKEWNARMPLDKSALPIGR
jgi:hypothetical protein